MANLEPPGLDFGSELQSQQSDTQDDLKAPPPYDTRNPDEVNAFQKKLADILNQGGGEQPEGGALASHR
jgi:hypothetical protein